MQSARELSKIHDSSVRLRNCLPYFYWNNNRRSWGFSHALTRKPPGGKSKQEQNQVNAEQPKMEKSWLYFLLAVVLIGNLVTLSPLIPSASFGLWTQAPTETITIQVENYHFHHATATDHPTRRESDSVVVSTDVTYGFGVFRKDGTMVFQLKGSSGTLQE